MSINFVKHYDSVQAFCNTAPSEANTVMWAAEGRESDSDWRFGDAVNAKTLRARVDTGWEAGAKRIQDLMVSEVQAPVSVKRRRIKADQGDSLDIHAVYRGQLGNAWERMRRDKRPSPSVIRIVAVVAGSCSQSADQFFYRGAAVARLTDMLTQAGYSVEVVAACVAQSISPYRQGDYCGTFQVKHSTAPLDLSQLAAVLCQQGFVRYFMFKNMASWAEKLGRHFGWYGNYDALDKLAINATSEDNVRTIVIKYGVDSKRRASEWIEESIRSVEGEDQTQQLTY